MKNICEFQYLIIKGYICALQLMWKMEWITLLEVRVRLHNDMICYWAIRFFFFKLLPSQWKILLLLNPSLHGKKNDNIECKISRQILYKHFVSNLSFMKLADTSKDNSSQ